MHACQSLTPLVETKMKKKNSFKIIIGFFFTPPLFLATKVAISFVYCSPKTIKCTQKPKIEKKFTGIDQSSECHSPHRIYNSLLRMRAIRELKRTICIKPFTCIIVKQQIVFFHIWMSFSTENWSTVHEIDWWNLCWYIGKSQKNPAMPQQSFECNYINTAYNRQPGRSCKGIAHMGLS